MWPLINHIPALRSLCWFDCYLVHVIGDLSQPLLDLLHVLALLLKLNNTRGQSEARRRRGDPPSWMFIIIKDNIWDVLTRCQLMNGLQRVSWSRATITLMLILPGLLLQFAIIKGLLSGAQAKEITSVTLCHIQHSFPFCSFNSMWHWPMCLKSARNNPFKSEIWDNTERKSHL